MSKKRKRDKGAVEPAAETTVGEAAPTEEASAEVAAPFEAAPDEATADEELAEDVPTRFAGEALPQAEPSEPFASEAEAVAPVEVSAAEELAEDVPTRFAQEMADAVAELAEDQPTPFGSGLDVIAPADDADAVAELAEDQPTRFADVAALRAAREGEASLEERFDFGGGAPNEDVPPDPGSADAASPRLQSICESLLFAADRPLGLRQLADLVEETEIERVRAAVLAVEQSWRERGVQLHEVAGGFQFRTHPQNAVWVQKLLQQKPVRLSRALLETLAICAYRQPITRPEIDEIRGVDSGGTLKTLMDRALVRILGKKEEPGRPLLYGTTKEFLEFFSLRDLKDLPTLREYHELSEEHQAQVAALEGAAPEGTIVPEGEAEDEPTESLPKLSRLEIAAPKEDAAELAEIDRLIRTAGATVATDSDLPPSGEEAAPAEEAVEPPEELAVTGKYDVLASAQEAAAAEFGEEREPTGTFGEPLPEPAAEAATEEFETEERTNLRGEGLDAELVDGRDPDKEPAA